MGQIYHGKLPLFQLSNLLYLQQLFPVLLKMCDEIQISLETADALLAKETVAREVVDKVRQFIGPIACFKEVIVVPRLPKTRSGKIARNTLAAIAAGKPYKVVNFINYVLSTL